MDVLSDSQITALMADWDKSEDELENSDDESDIDNFEFQNTFEELGNTDSYELIDINNLPVEIDFEGDTIKIPLTSNNDIFEPNFSVTSINTQEKVKNNDPLQFPTLNTNRKFLRSHDNTFMQTPHIHAISAPKNQKPKIISLKWKEGNLITNPSTIHHNQQLLNTNLHFETPLQFFNYFFTNELYDKIKYESELFAVQKNPEKSFQVSTDELKRFVGICLYASVCHVPNVRDYWSEQLGFAPIFEAMSQKRFEQIRQYLHFNDNDKMLSKDDPSHDRLHKIRPLVNYLNSKFGSIPYRRDLSLDEQLCATKAKNYLKQYLPMKPHKWGYKLFVLSDSKGYSYQFEIYTGQENQERFRLPGEIDLGSSANVVIRLTRGIPTKVNHRIYFDNYYTSIPLMSQLYEKGILSVGTVRRNRIPNCMLPDEKLLKKKNRGTSFECITSYKQAPISNLVWKDNKIVTLMSTYCGAEPKTLIKRFDKKIKKTTEIDCPYIIKEYNRFMGGVDLLDSLIGRYKIRLRSRKWFIRLWYHLVDMTAVNSWLLYKRVKEENMEPVKYSLAGWRKEIAFCLTKSGITKPVRGRSSNSLEGELQRIKRRRPVTSTPKDVRLDMFGHWARFQEKKGRCKIPHCTGTTFWKCSKCNQYLCQTKDKQCFEDFHCK